MQLKTLFIKFSCQILTFILTVARKPFERRPARSVVVRRDAVRRGSFREAHHPVFNNVSYTHVTKKGKFSNLYSQLESNEVCPPSAACSRPADVNYVLFVTTCSESSTDRASYTFTAVR